MFKLFSSCVLLLMSKSVLPKATDMHRGYLEMTIYVFGLYYSATEACFKYIDSIFVLNPEVKNHDVSGFHNFLDILGNLLTYKPNIAPVLKKVLGMA